MPGTVTVVDRDGNATDVPVENLAEYQRQGFQVESADQSASRNINEQRAADASPVEAVAQGALRGATFGLSDVAQRALGGEAARRHLESLQEFHPGLSAASSFGGALLTGGAAGLAGGATTEALGGGMLARLAGGAVEGGIFGAGNAASELALSDDPLTAEHIVGSLSSNILLGGGIGAGAAGLSRLAEIGLERAGGAVRSAQEAQAVAGALPEDLSSLDKDGLSDALKTATKERDAAIEAEKTNIESQRVEARKQIASDVKDLHQALADDAPISRALSNGDKLNPALGDIEGVSDARVQLAKSYKAIRSAFDSPLSVERDPQSLIRPLEQRQAALETLSSKMPEIQGALAGDSRAAALRYVDEALEQTKSQIDQIRATAKSAPMQSEKLATMIGEDGAKLASPRMQQIAKAQEVLANAPEMGLIGKVAQKTGAGLGAIAGHAVAGPLGAVFVGKAASDLVGLAAKRLGRVATSSAEKSEGMLSKFLSGAAKGAPDIPGAKAILSGVRYGVESEANEKTLGGLLRSRSEELRQQTMMAPDGSVQVRPEVRQQIASTFDGVRQASPTLADKLESSAVRKIEVQSQALPRRPDPVGPQNGPDKWKPSDLETRSFARVVRAVESPEYVEARLAHGIVTPDEAKAYMQAYPARHAKMTQDILQAMPTLPKPLPMKKLVALSIFTGQPMTLAMSPNVLSVLQSTFDNEPGSQGGTAAPKPTPSFTRFGSMKDQDKPTPAQERAQ